MSYKLAFDKAAKKEWDKLPPNIKEMFRKKLMTLRDNPHVPGSALSGAPNRYKIKLRSAGYRLAYEVDDDTIIILVVAVGKRENVYDKMNQRRGLPPAIAPTKGARRGRPPRKPK